MSRRGTLRCLLAPLVLALAGLPSVPEAPTQDGPEERPAAAEEPQPGEDAPPTDGPRAEADSAYEPIGFNLFPLYIHEFRPSDQTDFLQILGLFSRTSRPDGTGSTLFLPFFYSLHQVDPPDDRLFVFPLYYQRESPELSFRYLIPIYADHETPEFRMQSVLPVWMRVAFEGGKLTRTHVLYPLFRHTTDLRVEGRPARSARFGIPYILELFELRRTPKTIDVAAINFFNWSDEARGPLQLFGSHWVEEEWGDRGTTHFFPIYLHGAGAESSYRWIFPLFGYAVDGARRDFTLIPLLSRLGTGPGDAFRLFLAFPLFHYERGENLFTLASYPLFDYHRAEDRSRLGILFWLYRGYFRETGARSHNVLFPLSSFKKSADGSEGRNWIVPWFDLWSKKSRYTFIVPLYFNTKSYVEGTTAFFFTFALPTYFSFGSPDDSFSAGIPLYWAGREGSRGWTVLFPFYWNFYSAITRNLHAVPLFSYVSSPDRTQLFLGGPLYIHERFYGLDEEVRGTSHSLLWPLITIANRDDGFNYRFLPFFWYTRDQHTRGLLITPFYYQQSGPEGTFRYVFPVYARFKGPRETIDFRAAGAWTRRQEYTADGSVSFSSTNWLWWLATFQRNYVTGASHQRILPLGFWRTHSPSDSLTISAPFYYSHRFVQNDEVHRLRLFLGNVFLSKVVHRLPGGESGSDAVDSFSSGSPSGAEGEEAARVEFIEPEGPPTSVDRGVLWPLVRWYRDERGSRGHWFLPFYANVRDEQSSTLGLFPLYFQQKTEGPYQPSYFRYFYLFNRETFSEGSRLTIGQILFDLRRNEQARSRRLRLLYPLFEVSRDETSSSYLFTPLISGESRFAGGERYHANRFFPIYWEGSVDRLDAEGEWVPESDHFFVFPLFGRSRRSTRVDYRFLYPFFHLQRTPESLSWELWPSVFYRRNPALRALRFWPLHATETGETAGEFWVSRYLFFSKFFRRESETSYRLDPFLFRVNSGPGRFGIGGLFETLAYDTSPERTAFRVIPFAFGRAAGDTSLTAVIPFHFRRNYGSEPIDYWSPWRLFFLTSSLRGAGGERHFSVLTKLFDYTDNPERPDYVEYRFLHQFVFYLRTETAKRVEWNPFFQYFRDKAARRTVFSLLFSLYRRETVDGRTRHTLFYFIPF